MSDPVPCSEPALKRDPIPEQVRSQLTRILQSRSFQRADQISRLLSLIVEASLSGDHGELKEINVAAKVFGKTAYQYDSGLHSTVRSAANRLRKALDRYYTSEGLHDDVVISLPTGHYVACFQFRSVIEKNRAFLGSGSQPRPEDPEATVIGRQLELEFLTHRAAQSFVGPGTLTVLTAEPGMGKSTLMRHFSGSMAPERCTFAFGKCYQELGSGSPYLPWLEVLADLTGRSPHALQILATAAPGWAALIDSNPANGTLVTLGSLKRELLDLLTMLSRDQRLVICIDDLHWADLSSLDLLNFLCRNLDVVPAMVIVAFRRSDLFRSNSPFNSIEGELQMKGTCVPLEVLPLIPADIEKYLQIRLKSTAVSPELVSWLSERSEGNPLVLTVLFEFSSYGSDPSRALSAGDPVWIPAPTITAESSVPEPSSMYLLGGAIIGMGILRRRAFLVLSRFQVLQSSVMTG